VRCHERSFRNSCIVPFMAQAVWKDPVIEAYKRDVDLTLLKKNLRLTPEERILAAMELQKLAEEVRRAGREARRGRPDRAADRPPPGIEIPGYPR
jgi:hypothetical protein